MKEKYNEAELEIISFENTDIITESDGVPEFSPDGQG